MPCDQYRYEDKVVSVHMNIYHGTGFVRSLDILVTWLAIICC